MHCHNDLGMAVANSLAAVRGRCAADRVHDQRHRRARRATARSKKSSWRCRRAANSSACTPASIPPPLSDLSPGLEHHRHADSAQQSHRRRERVRARSRHSPARHAQAPLDLRDHAARRRGSVAHQPRARQAQRPPCVSRARQGARLRARRRSSSTACSKSSRRWRTRRRSSSTATSRRSCCALKDAASGPWQLMELSTVGREQRSRGGGLAAARRRHAPSKSTATGDGPVDAAFKAIEAATGIDGGAAQVRSARRDRGRRCAGRGDGLRRVQPAHLSGLERQHQHRRVGHPALSSKSSTASSWPQAGPAREERSRPRAAL